MMFQGGIIESDVHKRGKCDENVDEDAKVTQ